MKKIATWGLIAVMTMPAYAATPAESGRRAMANQWAPAARTMTASKNQLNGWANAPKPVQPNPEPEEVDKREKERAACLGNNIGAGNTFVWASRYSNTGNYASMVEDVENPENNVCFVRVELKSDDAKINVADVPAVYYEMGRTITCGEWADSGKIKDRILAAKKSGRTWGTVAGAVGGAGLGVGLMELGGNRLIGGKVEGQKYLADTDEVALVRSQLAVAGKSSPEYQEFMQNLRTLKTECTSTDWVGNDSQQPAVCQTWEQYFMLLDS